MSIIVVDSQIETVYLLIGMASWLMALIVFIVDEIFMLGDLIEDQGPAADHLTLDLLNNKSKQYYIGLYITPELESLSEADMIPVREITSPALPLLLISSSRLFLKLACNCIRGGLNPLIKAQKELILTPSSLLTVNSKPSSRNPPSQSRNSTFCFPSSTPASRKPTRPE